MHSGYFAFPLEGTLECFFFFYLEFSFPQFFSPDGCGRSEMRHFPFGINKAFTVLYEDSISLLPSAKGASEIEERFTSRIGCFDVIPRPQFSPGQYSTCTDSTVPPLIPITRQSRRNHLEEARAT